MPFYQCDSSGLVKRYVDEVGSDWVRTIVDPASANIVSIADITRAEVTSALARRAREGVITPLYGQSRGRPRRALLAQDRFSHAL
jgi:hypothetical protein